MSYHATQRAKGLCGNCSSPPAPGRSLCERHLAQHRESEARRFHAACDAAEDAARERLASTVTRWSPERIAEENRKRGVKP